MVLQRIIRRKMIFVKFLQEINSSKGLTNTQKRTVVENEELAKVVFELKSHPVFTKITKFFI